MKTQDEYYLYKTIDYHGKINIYRPIISEEERARRYKEIYIAAERLIKEAMRTEKC